MTEQGGGVRNGPIDLLRAIGLAMIVLAHVEPPRWVFQLRNFDVPLMVLVAGMSYALASGANERLRGYLWKRAKRLLAPVWIFLAGYFLADLALEPPRGSFDLETVAESFLLIDGIGYVWIIRVFLLVALFAPLVAWFDRTTQSDARYLATLALVYAGYELLRALVLPVAGSLPRRLVELSVLVAVPYSILFAIGLRAHRLQPPALVLICLLSLVAFTGAGLLLHESHGRPVGTQAFKYPPSLYYLSYALFVYTVLLAASGPAWRLLARTPLAAPVSFIARNSIWIYLWHIPLLALIDDRWLLEYAFVLAGASAIVYAQVQLVTRLVMPRVARASTRRNLELVFTG